MQLAPTSGQPTLASLSTEDGVTVGVGLAPASGVGTSPMFAPSKVTTASSPNMAAQAAAATPVTGQVTLNTITYPSVTFPGVPAPLPASTLTATTPSTSTAGGLSLYVGYADSARPNPNLPVPWRGAPNTLFLGDGGPYDSGAIRLDNTTGTTATVRDVSVYFPNHNMYTCPSTPTPACQTFDLWGAFAIAPHGSAILAETNGQNFDTSDYGIPGVACSNLAGPTNNPPLITITQGDGAQVTMTDTAHVLDTGGTDAVNCGSNESLQWRALGTTGAGQASGSLTLATPATAQIVGVPYTALATLADASGQPQPNVAVSFAVTSGPDAGVSGQAYTDSQGRATFTYTGTVAGTDTLAASLTNASGGVLAAPPVSVTWEPAPVADLALRAIASGLDVRIVLHNANASGPFTLALAPDPATNTQLAQDPTGAIQAMRPITQYGDDGTPAVITQTEYTVATAGATTNATRAMANASAATASPSPGPYNDGAQFIYGESGSYTADDPTLAGNGSAPVSDAGSVTPACTSNGVTFGFRGAEPLPRAGRPDDPPRRGGASVRLR